MSYLVVEVLDANDLMPTDGQGSLNPFVEVRFDEQRLRTRTKSRTLNPHWNEKLVFNINNPTDLPYKTVEVVLYHENLREGDDVHSQGHDNRFFRLVRNSGRFEWFLGHVRIAGVSIPLSKSLATVVRYPLKKRSSLSTIKGFKGDVALKIYEVVDEIKYLYVAVIKAKDLPFVYGRVEYLNPFVEVKLGNYRGLTKHVTKNQNPVWNKILAFPIEGIQADLLEVTVMDKDRFMLDTFVGRVLFSPAEVFVRVPTDTPQWVRLEDKRGDLIDSGEIMLAFWSGSGTQDDDTFPVASHVDVHFHLANTRLKDDYTVPEEVEYAGFKICADELTSIVEGEDVEKLSIHGGVEGIAVKLSTSIVSGISTSEDLLNRRRKIYGVNKYLESPARSFWVFVQEAFQDRTLLILGVCAFLSLITGIAMGWPKNAYDGFEILASILLVVVVTATSDYKQYLQFQVFEKEKKNVFVHATRNGLRENVSTCDLVPGDIVHLSIRDRVQADGLFVSGFSLLINESSLTGLSDPVQVNAANPFILSGMKVQDGSCKMLVTNVGMRTKWGKLIAAVGEAGHDETPLQVKLNGVATVTGKIGLYFGVLTFFILVGGLFRYNLHEGKHWVCNIEYAMAILQFFSVAVSIVVVAVPEGLPLSVNLSLAFSMKKMMNDKAMVRHLAACETMGSTTAICTGKTGTLTTNHMTLVKICICGEIKEVDNSKSSLKLLSTTPDLALRILFESIFNNTGGEVVSDRNNKVEILGSPIEVSLLELGLLLGGNMQEERGKSKIVKVEPFNNTKKRMAVVLELPEGGFRAHYKGASEVILGACDKFINTNGEVVPLDEASFNRFMSTIEQFASEALQTICLAYLEIGSKFSANSTIPFEGYTLIGIMGIKNPLRPGVKESVAICQLAGIVVRMVTGDNITTAMAIARECGILTDKGIAIEAREFQEKSEEELLQLIPKIQVMAQCSSFDKHMLVKNLRKNFREVVAVTGGDINDVPTLHEADIGLVMGMGGTEVAKESADAIIQDDNFSTIVTLAKWGRSIYVNIQKLVQFQLTFIIVFLNVHFFLTCLTGKAPLTPAQLLWVNLIADTSGGLALVSEPPKDDLMKRPPVCRTGNFINNIMWRNILGQSMYQFAMICYLHSRGKGVFHLEGLDSDSVLNTLTFNSLVFCQVFNMMNCREIEKINVFRGIMKNYAFVGVIGCIFHFQIVIVQFICTSHLSLEQWTFTIFLGFLSMPIAAAVKMLPFC